MYMYVPQDEFHLQSSCPVLSSVVTLPIYERKKKISYFGGFPHSMTGREFKFKPTNPVSGEGVRGIMCNLIGSTASKFFGDIST